MNSDNSYDLSSVWGSSGNDVFAVGESGTILHYDGSTWSSMIAGTTDGLNLRGVWGSSANDVFAVGQSGTILHYTGNGWASIESGIERHVYISAIWGNSYEDIFAVGGYGTIQHYDGSSWFPINPPSIDRLDGSGGGLYLQDSNEIALDSTLVASNQVALAGYGSGIYASNSSAMMRHTTLASNSGGDGSGIYANNATALKGNQPLRDGDDLCYPALWLDRALVAYSRHGCQKKSWKLPPTWDGVKMVDISRIILKGPKPLARAPVENGRIALTLQAGQGVLLIAGKDDQP